MTTADVALPDEYGPTLQTLKDRVRGARVKVQRTVNTQGGRMAEKPADFEWVGFTNGQARLLDFTDHLGNNGWDRNGQTSELMPKHLSKCAEAGLSIGQIVEAMQRIGYDKKTVHQLKRWESKRLTGKFGR